MDNVKLVLAAGQTGSQKSTVDLQSVEEEVSKSYQLCWLQKEEKSRPKQWQTQHCTVQSMCKPANNLQHLIQIWCCYHLWVLNNFIKRRAVYKATMQRVSYIYVGKKHVLLCWVYVTVSALCVNMWSSFISFQTEPFNKATTGTALTEYSGGFGVNQNFYS